MKDYVFIVRHKGLTPEMLATVTPRWRAIMPRWVEQGHFVGSSLLLNEGHLISGAERIITTAPAITAESQQIVLSIIRIQAEDFEQAMQLALESPTLDTGGSIEVREVRPAPSANPIQS